ncbi:MAG: hypothetical protein A2144_04425 [Chloroflexi bacterium RBG_16_50_9]|nr:MAG: hypothetical protein A2144_04425 [Chloroflexi bacterium RBG_16_50_9]
MDIKPTEEELSKLQESLSLLADIISDGINPDKAALEKIILRVGLNSNHQWIRNILERAYPLLERAHNDVHGNEKKLIVAELEALGMKNFPAILTYDKAKPKPLSAEPQFIDFGCLELGKDADRNLRVTGGAVIDVSFSDPKKLRDLGCSGAIKHENSRDYYLELVGISVAIKWLTAKDGGTLIKFIISGRLPGVSLNDYITITTNRGELKIPLAIKVEKTEVIITKEPPFLSRCPICDPKINRKTLFYGKARRGYRCSQCEHEFPYPDKRVSEYNDAHR